MRFVIQRVSESAVEVDGKTVGAIKKGYMVLIGISDADTEARADKMVRKMLNLRIFEDENGKTNRSLSDASGALLLISQFTLYADCRHGNRPGFTNAGKPEHASALYDYIVNLCREAGYQAECGIFGADMKVSLTNDGPFTIILDSEELGF
ncbi:MAG: D-tyrosyl-tRNA(Tyr) deacylase [Lachnospiraceae bacterium]|nr:D-tyrosyl-tRNA(Tyr) deacylase [Lachnospiraceae bacterium]